MSALAGRRTCKRLLLGLGLWLALTGLPALAQGPAESSLQDIRAHLVALGFENLLLDRNGDQYYIQYENRRYLHEIRAMGKLLSTLAPLLPLDATLHLYV